MTDDQITELVVSTLTGSCRYGEEELNCLVGSVITEELGLDHDLVSSELVDESIRQVRLAIGNTTGYARAIVEANNRSGLERAAG